MAMRWNQFVTVATDVPLQYLTHNVGHQSKVLHGNEIQMMIAEPRMKIGLVAKPKLIIFMWKCC
jgi:hypothetical protein